MHIYVYMLMYKFWDVTTENDMFLVSQTVGILHVYSVNISQKSLWK